MFDLTEGFLNGDDDCWVSPDGEIHELDRQSRETHRAYIERICPDLDPTHAVKQACFLGWVRVWVEGQTAFLELDFQHAARKAIDATRRVLQAAPTVQKVWVEDSASMAYETFDDIRSASSRLIRLATKRQITSMFEDSNHVYVPKINLDIDTSRLFD